MNKIEILPVDCDPDPRALNELRTVTTWASNITLQGNYLVLQSILITPKNKINEIANSLIEKYEDNGKEINSPASAISLSIISKGRLLCWILLEEDLIGNTYVDSLIRDQLGSTMLEELFHVKHYVITFNRRGFIKYPNSYSDACNVKLLNIAYHFVDEYLAGRWKAETIDAELSFGKNLPDHISDALVKLAEIILAYWEQKIDFDLASEKTLSLITRNVFGSLVRESARRDPKTNQKSPAGDPSQSELYMEYVYPYWKNIHNNLVSIYKNPHSSDHLEYNIAQELRSFLQTVGMHLSIPEDNGCHLDFNTFWALSVLEA